MTTKIKLRKFMLGKMMPDFLFDFIVWTWRATGRKFLNVYEWILILFLFQKKKVVNLYHKRVAFKQVIDPKNGYIDKYIFLHGPYEDYILDVIAKYLPSEGVMFDIGANIGQHSLFAASFLKGTGKVYAFEPVANLFDQMKKSAELNNFANLELINFACGDNNSSGFMGTNNSNAGGSSLVVLDEATEMVKVEIKRLDDIFNDLPKLNLIKMDVEGYEYAALKGGENLILRTLPVIIFEFSPMMYDKFDPSLSEKILDFLLPHYELIDIADGDVIIKDKNLYLSYFRDRKRTQSNILCLPK